MKTNFPEKSWINPKIEIKKSKTQGRGMFAKKLIKKGEIVVIWGSNYVSKKEAMKFKNKNNKLIMQLDENLFSIEERGDDITYFMNHSCNPNVWMKNAFTLIARRNIQKNEELTADYALWEGDKNFIAKWECHCNSKLCREKITGKDWKLKILQRKYKNHFSPLINKRIKNKL